MQGVEVTLPIALNALVEKVKSPVGGEELSRIVALDGIEMNDDKFITYESIAWIGFGSRILRSYLVYFIYVHSFIHFFHH